MALINDSIVKIRRMIGDVEEKVFSDERILRVYNRVRMDFLVKQETLTRVRFLPAPPPFEFGCSRRWEAGAVEGSTWLPFVEESINQFSVSQEWEVQASLGVGTDLSGGYVITTGSDATAVDYENLISYPLPDNLSRLLGVFWQGREVKMITMDKLRRLDYNWRRRKSEYVTHFALDPAYEEERFFPYPAPTLHGRTVSGSGLPIWVDGDGIVWDDGQDGLAISGFGLDEGDDGVVCSVGSHLEGFVFIFIAMAEDVALGEEDTKIPRGFRKYLEFATVAELLMMDTELRNDKKRGFYSALYGLGLSKVQMMKDGLNSLKSYGEDAKGVGMRGLGRVQFPDHFPKVWQDGR